MDAHLTAVLAKYPHWLLTASPAAMDAEELSAGEEDKDKLRVLVILRFTAALLEKAAGKEIYASAEVSAAALLPCALFICAPMSSVLPYSYAPILWRAICSRTVRVHRVGDLYHMSAQA